MTLLLIGIIAIFAQPLKHGEYRYQTEYAYQVETPYPQEQDAQSPRLSGSENTGTQSTSQHQNDSANKQGYWQQTFAPGNLPTWFLVLIGWLGVWAAIATFFVIGWQAIETKKAAQATQISAKAAYEGIKLQKALNAQWLDLENWAVDGPGNSFNEIFESSFKATTLTIRFRIANKTNLPLILRGIKLYVINRSKEASVRIDLTPKSDIPMDFPIVLRDEETAFYFKDQLVLNLFGFVLFTDAFGDKQQHRFGKLCVCKPTVYSFSDFYEWLPDEEEEEE